MMTTLSNLVLLNAGALRPRETRHPRRQRRPLHHRRRKASNHRTDVRSWAELRRPRRILVLFPPAVARSRTLWKHYPVESKRLQPNAEFDPKQTG